MTQKRTAKRAASFPAGAHYMTVVALVMSLVTTFLLGLLLTEATFGTGLDYFSNVKNQARVGSASAKMVRPSAQQPSTRYLVSFEGTISIVNDDFDIVTDDIAEGDTFSGSYIIDTGTRDQRSEDPEWGMYTLSTDITLAIGGGEYIMRNGTQTVHNALPDVDWTGTDGISYDMDKGLYAMNLALPAKGDDLWANDAIPMNVGVQDFVEPTFSLFAMGSGSWRVVGDIESLSYAPIR